MADGISSRTSEPYVGSDLHQRVQDRLARGTNRSAASGSDAGVVEAGLSCGGRVVRWFKNAALSIRDAFRRLIDTVASLFTSCAPTDKELGIEARETKWKIGDCWRGFKRSVSDFFCPPSAATRMKRGIQDAARKTGRGCQRLAD